jgi:hypothetical protein
MKSSWKPPREDRIDAEAVRREQRYLQDLQNILEYGTEDDFVAFLKLNKPGIKKEELQALIRQFHAYVREKRGLC